MPNDLAPELAHMALFVAVFGSAVAFLLIGFAIYSDWYYRKNKRREEVKRAIEKERELRR